MNRNRQKRGACLRYMVNGHRRLRARVKDIWRSGIAERRGVFEIYDDIMMSRYHQKRGVFKIGGVFILFFFGSGCARGLWAFGSLRLLGFLGFLVFRFLGFLAPFLGFLASRLLVTSWLGVQLLPSALVWLLGFLGFLVFRFLGFLASRLLVTSWLGV